MRIELSPFFKRHEFSCKCYCGFNAVDAELLRVLEHLRAGMGGPVIITSANRCKNHNLTVGGEPGSYHTLGMAADIKVGGVSADAVADYLEQEYPGRYGIGRYPSWTHIDVRGKMARWSKK